MTRFRRNDDGFVLVVAALMLVTLMAFAALAVDLGGLYNERRQDQSGADMAALAGVRELPTTSVAATEAIEYAEKTLGVPPGSLDFDSCDGDPGALDNQITGYNCLSVNNGGNRLRVRLPDQQYTTFFAHLVGLDDFTHSAAAEAEFVGAGFGNVLPFGIPSLGGGGGYICPASPPGGLATAPCSGPDGGNFGYLNMAFYETAECNTGGGANRFGQNLAMGADHEIAIYDDDPRLEHTLCPEIGPDGPPNVMKTETGNIANRVAEGMIHGPGNHNTLGSYPDGESGRLTRFSPDLFAGTAPAAPSRVDVGPAEVDDNPLWNFIPASLSSGSSHVPASCERSVFVKPDGSPASDLSGLNPNFGTSDERDTFAGLVEDWAAGASDAEVMIALLDRCFTHYQGEPWGSDYGITEPEPSTCPAAGGCTDPVFAVDSSETDAPDLWDIQYTSRFGYVPEFGADCDVNGTSDCAIERFRAIFIQQTCMGTAHCDDPLDPGFGDDRGSMPSSITGVTAWAFPDTMLPGGLGAPDAPTAIGVNRFIELVR